MADGTLRNEPQCIACLCATRNGPKLRVEGAPKQAGVALQHAKAVAA